jgi:hypothetical protein
MALSLAATPTSGRETTHQNPDFCYSIEVPAGWNVTSGDAHSRRYRVLTWVSNVEPPAQPILRGRVPTGSREHYDTETRRWITSSTSRSETILEAAERILEPGTVSINVGITHAGISGFPYYVRHPTAHPDHRIREFLLAPVPQYDSEQLLIFQTSAGLWGRSWAISIYCRKPFAEEDLKEAFLILQSLAFPAVPVVFKAHAVELVIPHIPKHALHDLSGLECVSPADFEDWRIQDEVDGYRVTYTQLDGVYEEPRPLRAYRYFVTRDGQVKLLASRKGKRFPESQPESAAIRRR